MASSAPVTEAQAALLDELAALLEARGIEPFVAAPLLEPDDRYFPDEWHATSSSAQQLATRLLAYARLPLDTPVELTTAEQRLQDPLRVVATIAHEVARAYRQVHALDGDEPASEGQVSLTTIYLGFGILTTNASYRYRAKGDVRGAMAITEWSHERLGGLAPEAMSFLLAVQLAARDATSSQVRAVVRQLEPNQRAYFEGAYRTLMPEFVTLRLRLPDRATWAAPWPLPPTPEGRSVKSWLGLDREAEHLPKAEVVKGGQARANAQRSTFRVIGTAAAPWLGLGLLVGVGAFVAVALIRSRTVSGPPLADFPVWGILTMLFVPPVLGFVLGRRQRRDVCSDPTCHAPLPQTVTACPRCGGTIMATLKSANERLDAEERLQLNRDEHDIDVGSESTVLAPDARPIFTPAGVAGSLIGAGGHAGPDADEIERGGSSTVI